MISCRQACELISEGRDEKLSFGDAMALRVHLVMCPHCRRYKQHLEQMGGFAERYRSGGPGEGESVEE